MASDSILMVGGKKCTVAVYPRGIEGSPRIFNNVHWWKVAYKQVLILRGADWTEVFSDEAWNRISVVEK